MATHFLKTVNPYFSDVYNLLKTFEFRFNDRNYMVNDVLVLHEFEPLIHTFTGRFVCATVTHILSNADFSQVPSDFVIMSLKVFYISPSTSNRLQPTPM